MNIEFRGSLRTLKTTFGYLGLNAQRPIVAAMLAGSSVGSFLVALFAAFREEGSLSWSLSTRVIGSILRCTTQNRGMLIGSGTSIGWASSCVPLYHSEICGSPVDEEEPSVDFLHPFLRSTQSYLCAPALVA